MHFLIEKFSDLRNYDLKNKSILLAIGVRHLQEAFIFARNSGANVYARVLANPESIRKNTVFINSKKQILRY